MLNRRKKTWLAMSAVAMLVLAACGADEPVDDAAPDDEPDAAEEPEETDEPAGWEPTSDVTVTVPFSPGGGADTSQRTWNATAEPLLDVSLNVDNPEGAGGVTGWGQFLRSEPDGHNIAIATPPFNVMPKVVDPEAVPYEHEDFTYVCIYGVVPGAVFVPVDSEWETLDDFIEAAREDPGSITVAVTGAAGAEAVIVGLLMAAADIELTMVPYDGGAESVVATRGGTTDAMIGSTTYVAEQAEELRALAISRASDDDPEYPDIPSFNQEGYNVVSERYRAIALPPGVDQEVIDFWEDICRQVSEDEEFRQAAADTGNPAPPSFIGADEATDLVMQMVADVEAVVADLGLADE